MELKPKERGVFRSASEFGTEVCSIYLTPKFTANAIYTLPSLGRLFYYRVIFIVRRPQFPLTY